MLMRIKRGIRAPAAGGSNFSNFKSPEADHLLEMARQEFDAESANNCTGSGKDIFQDEQPLPSFTTFRNPDGL